MKLNELMFREYDIRGIVDEDINEEIAYLIGRGFGSNLAKLGKKITTVGYDNRLSSPWIEEKLVKGITESGVNVIRLGLVTSPMYYFASDHLNTKCGLMITASHNPKEYNGFKFSYNGLHNAYGKDVKDLYHTIINKEFTNGNGTYSNYDIKKDYIKLITNDLKINKKLKVVIDCGNGTTSIIAKEIFSTFDNIELISICDESDGDFPNHHPDPSVESNLQMLKDKVLETNADIGLAFDGDGDRAGIVDENGQMIDMDKYQIIIWRDIYNKVTKKEALFDVKCSKALEDELIKLNIKPNCYRTGNSYMKAKSVEGDYPLSGELSGHIFFRDRFPGYDDGIYAGLRLVEILSNTDKKLSQLLDNINIYFSSKELKLKIDDEKKELFVNKVKEYCENKNYKMLTIDGVKVLFNDGWAMVRASNTGPNITYRDEGKTKERLQEIENEFNDLLDKISNEIN